LVVVAKAVCNQQPSALMLAVCFAFAVHHVTEIGIESGDLLVDSLQGSSFGKTALFNRHDLCINLVRDHGGPVRASGKEQEKEEKGGARSNSSARLGASHQRWIFRPSF
jgi:hypothetical protein